MDLIEWFLLGSENMNCSFRSEESPSGAGGLGSGILLLLECKRDGRGKTSEGSESPLHRAGVYLVQLYVLREEMQVMKQLCYYPVHERVTKERRME